MVRIKLKSYLQKLIDEGHDNVPTIADISKDTGLYYTGLNRMVNHHTTQLRFDTATKIIDAVRKRGFDMQISDLIDYVSDYVPNQ